MVDMPPSSNVQPPLPSTIHQSPSHCPLTPIFCRFGPIKVPGYSTKEVYPPDKTGKLIHSGTGHLAHCDTKKLVVQ